MKNEDVATLKFVDADGQEVVSIVRISNGNVAVCLSRKDDGDIEVSLQPKDAQLLVDAVVRAIRTIRN